ncbi:MAG: response regulator transcription factor [Nitrosomonadales bacterium]|nr:response regulator transcription factor [Nitrosomonadales bacterium]
MKILLIDHHALFREGLRRILQQLPGGVGEILEAGNFTDGLNLARHHPDLDLALIESKSPGCEGAISIKFFRQCYPHIPVVVVSSEEGHLATNKALNNGASGFVNKRSTVPILLNTLNLVLPGNVYVSPQFLQKSGMATWNKSNPNGIRGPNAGEHGLTARQVDVLRCLAAGLSNKEIAEAINLAEGTAKAHIAAIYQILRVNNRIEAMRVAKQLGLGGMPHSAVKPESGKLPGHAGLIGSGAETMMKRIQI